MTYPKRTIDLQPGDVLSMYGARERVAEVLKVDPSARYTAVSIMAESLTRSGADTPRFMCLDNSHVRVELPANHRVIAVPIAGE